MADLPNTIAMDDEFDIDLITPTPNTTSTAINTNISPEIHGYLIRIDNNGNNDTPFILTKRTTSIGRSPSNDIILTEPTISSLHAEIEINLLSSTAYIIDLNSSNKTRIGPSLPTNSYHNPPKKPNRECIVNSGDYVTFG
eukprot:507177_1